MSDPIEDRLRRTLRAKAAQVVVADDGAPAVAIERRRPTAITLAAAAIVLAALVGGLVLAARAGDDSSAPPATDPTPTSTPSTTTSTPTTSTVPTTTAVPASTTVPVGGGLPGEPYGFPSEGSSLDVAGVAAGDVLNMRAGPGVSFDVVGTLGPLHEDVVATGRNRLFLMEPIWAEVEAEGRVGWVNTSFLVYLGGVSDETARLYPDPADRPSASSMTDLAQEVAADVLGARWRVTVADGPTVGDLHEVTVDVRGQGDDSFAGYRLHLFAVPDPSGTSFTLRTVESTVLCARGSDGETCV